VPLVSKNLSPLQGAAIWQVENAIEDYSKSMQTRGGATVLKVGGQFCKRSEQKKFFDPPLFGQWGGTKYS